MLTQGVIICSIMLVERSDISKIKYNSYMVFLPSKAELHKKLILARPMLKIMFEIQAKPGQGVTSLSHIQLKKDNTGATLYHFARTFSARV